MSDDRSFPPRVKALVEKATNVYNEYSILPKVIKPLDFDKERDSKKEFKKFAYKFRMELKWFEEPNWIPDPSFLELGRMVAQSEQKFLTEQLRDDTRISHVFTTPTREDFVGILEKFDSQNSSVNAVLAPIVYYQKFFEWLNDNFKVISWK